MGDEEALNIYKILQRHTCKVVESVSCARYLYYAGEIGSHDEWSQDTFQKRLQSGATLGDRMYTAFEEVLSLYEKAIIIGSDCAQLRPKHIQEAIGLLDEKDVVIGPAMDGGYYLLGMKTPHKILFTDIPWSTDQVCHLTLQKAYGVDLSVVELETLSDIDTYVDWKDYGKDFVMG